MLSEALESMIQGSSHLVEDAGRVGELPVRAKAEDAVVGESRL